MQGLKNNKMAIILIVVVVLAGGYYLLNRGGDPADGTALNTTEIRPETIRILELLQKLKIVGQKLDPQFFADPIFASLRDFTVTIPPEIPGRPNPFQATVVTVPTPPRAR